MRTYLAAIAAAFLLSAPSGADTPNVTSPPATAPSKPAASTGKKKAKKIARRRGRIKTTAARAPYVSPAVRARAVAVVNDDASQGASIPIDDPAALVPFFEQLFRQQSGETGGLLHILQYGDSHTAADTWTGELRTRFQSRFGDGGSGYSFAGQPWSSYRHLDLSTGSTAGWSVEGLAGHPGDGLYGLGGVSMSVSRPHESVYLVVECQQLELFYLQQPGGGAVQLYDNGSPVERISTDGESGPGYYRYLTTAGSHRFELETLDHGPVRLFGWVAENSGGITYDPLGINGAQASIVFNWDQQLLASNIARRNPALIVLAYGTNEAGDREWTPESYREMFSALLQRFRRDAPTASILVMGPPDRYIRTHGRWSAMQNIGMIVEAQRQAALANQCAFLDVREMMGGKGSMQQWVTAGMAQYDHVHFTGPGYRLLGDTIFGDLMTEYRTFVTARQQWVAGQSSPAATAGSNSAGSN
ncbi:MAG: GDSL-type esterase/lipase family protein [Bryobacteraceae bacterium]